MNNKNQSPLKKLLGIRGMGAALTAFAGLIIIYIAFGLINPAVFSGQNILNLLRSMSKYLLIGIAQSYILITGNIDLSIGSMVGMSAMISATLMTHGVHPLFAILVALLACLATGVVNGYLVGKFKLPPFIATLGTMFVTRGVAYMVNSNRNTDAIATGIGKEAADKFQNFFTTERHWAYTIPSGLPSWYLSCSSLFFQRQEPDAIFTRSVPISMRQSSPA